MAVFLLAFLPKFCLFVFGLVFGSFLSALTYRLPKAMSVSKGRSICPHCKHEISWYDNVPLFSYLLLRGKCRNCKEKISIRYPIIELGTATLFLLIGFNIIDLILVCILIAIFVIDFENQIIPDELVFFGFALWFVGALITGTPLLFENIFAGLISGMLLLVLHIVTKGKGMGLGDVKLAILLGSIAGLNLFLIWLFFSFVAGSIIGIMLILFKKAKFRQEVPFGPFLITGLGLAFIFGQSFLKLVGF